MSAAPVRTGGLTTRSEIEDWPTTHLDDAANRWRERATESETAFDQHRLNIAAPAGTEWSGDAKDAALYRVTADCSAVRRQGDVQREAASTAENGSADIKAAQRNALNAIAEAEADGFTVNEDLSLTDTRYASSLLRAPANRAQTAVEHAEYIRWNAEQLVKTDSLVGERLTAKAAELQGIRFDGERDDGHDLTQLVSNEIKETPFDAPFPLDPAPAGGSIEVDDSAIDREAPIFPPNLMPRDKEFAASDKNGLERTLLGNKARAKGELAIAYMRAHGWDLTGDVMDHYMANESGGRDPSMAKPFRLSTAQTDALANDTTSGYQGNQALPGVLENARQTAIANAANSGQSVYTEVYGADPNTAAMGKGWNPVGTSNPDNVYALGRYSVQVVTQVEIGSDHEPIVRQRYFVYDYTDYAHPNGVGGGPMENMKRAAIDDLATLRDIGWARGFDTTGTSSIRTLAQ